MSTSLRRTGSVNIQTNTKRGSATGSLSVNKRGSAYLGVGGPVGVEAGAVSPESLMDEAAALRKIIDGLNRTNAALRGKISDLEIHIEHGTEPEVERLSKELFTLEDLFAQTQRDNEEKHAESERQKAYVKELESLLSTSLGPNWKESHNLYPPAATTTTVTPSTPLPAPKPAPSSALRHSVSFSNKRSMSKVHRRASSVMDLNLICLQAVKEDDAGLDDTPTGALRKLNGSLNGKARLGAPLGDGPGCGKGQERISERPLEAFATPDISSKGKAFTAPIADDLHQSIALGPHAPEPALSAIDVDQLNSVLHLVSSADLVEALSQIRSHTKGGSAPARETATSKSATRDTQVKMIKHMLAEQEKRLIEREGKLLDIVKMAKEKEQRYELAL
ncbi:hypothetical protein I317_03625 [Kwoniella heveanensis CBS 569]|nr:hypothetical protein I317_03625 [Kwoniella heveanensis CBS 569]